MTNEGPGESSTASTPQSQPEVVYLKILTGDRTHQYYTLSTFFVCTKIKPEKGHKVFILKKL